MAICKMLEMKLVGTECEENALMDALHKTGAVELKVCEPEFSCEKRSRDSGEVSAKLEKIENAVEILAKCALKEGEKVEPDGIGVTYKEFSEISAEEAELLAVADGVIAQKERINMLEAHAVALKTEYASYEQYAGIGKPFSAFKNTEKTRCRLGTVDLNGYRKLSEECEKTGLALVLRECGERSRAVAVLYHASAEKAVSAAISASGFSLCPFSGEFTAEEKMAEIKKEESATESEKQNSLEKITTEFARVKKLKILADYYLFIKEKNDASGEFSRTASTFMLTAYVPEERKEEVLEAVRSVTRAAYTEFREIGEDEFAPTLMKNKKVPKQFEFVTNLYSVPKYRSFDPNVVLGVFFSVFMGFINADVGYGVLMTVGGLLFASLQKRDTAITRLARVMAYSGLFTVAFGFLSDSLFGIPFMRSLGWISSPIMPDPIKDNSSLAGINIPTVLLISLGMGVIHIMAGLFISAIVHFRHGRIIDGICDGIIWDLFLLGLIVFVLGLIGTLGELAVTVGAALAVGSVVAGALTAGRHAKGFGKFSKGFGAVYGIINYMSDILSYARLYGLMLSGAQIASIVSNNLAIPMLTSPGGAFGWVACILIMIVGHAFNMAMGLLGAFVHDARLQYVEFFSHFYEGDGELFSPMGARFNHIYIDG